MVTDTNTIEVVDVRAIADELRAEVASLDAWIGAHPDDRDTEPARSRRYNAARLARIFADAPLDTTRVLIIGGNVREGEDFAHRHGIPRHLAIVVGDPDRLRGRTLAHTLVVRIGTWYSRPDREYIEQQLKIMGATLCR